jgi:nitrite reductase/ring-hydroxylating ferredoxin subunit
MELMYAGMPTLHQFQKDSSITFAVRKQDMILTRIDDALAAYNNPCRSGHKRCRQGTEDREQETGDK